MTYIMSKINDLRSALELLKTMENQLIETDVEVDPMAELSGVYRHVGQVELYNVQQKKVLQ